MSLHRNWGLLLLLPLVLVSVSSPLWGEASGPVVAIVHRDETALVERLGTEIALLGFRPEVVIREEPISPETFGTIAAELNAAAVVYIDSDSARIDIWSSRGDGGREQIEAVPIPGSREQDLAIAAFRAGELLRAAVLLGGEASEDAPSSEPDAGESTPASTNPPEASRRETASGRKRGARLERRAARTKTAPHRLSLAVAPAVAYAFGKLPPAFQIGAALAYHLTPRWFVALTGLSPSVPSRVFIATGAIEVTAGYVVLGGGVRLTPPKWRVSVPLELFAGVAIVSMIGIPENSTEDQGWLQKILVAIMGGRTGVTVKLSEMVSLRADLVIATCEPRPVATVMDEKWSGWGRPFLTGMLGVEVWLF